MNQQTINILLSLWLQYCESYNCLSAYNFTRLWHQNPSQNCPTKSMQFAWSNGYVTLSALKAWSSKQFLAWIKINKMDISLTTNMCHLHSDLVVTYDQKKLPTVCCLESTIKKETTVSLRLILFVVKCQGRQPMLDLQQ